MKLVRYNYSESGGMRGGSSEISIKHTEDGHCLVYSRNRAGHNQPDYVKNYHADGLLEKMDEVCARFQVISWTDLKPSEFFAADAPTINYNFSFDDGTLIAFGSSKMPPEGWRQVRAEIDRLITDSESYGVDVEPEPQEKSPMPGGMPAMGMMGMMGMGMMNPGPMFGMGTTGEQIVVKINKDEDKNED